MAELCSPADGNDGDAAQEEDVMRVLRLFQLSDADAHCRGHADPVPEHDRDAAAAQ